MSSGIASFTEILGAGLAKHGKVIARANAVVDALSHLGVTHIDIPITPEKVWRLSPGGSRAEAAVDRSSMICTPIGRLSE